MTNSIAAAALLFFLLSLARVEAGDMGFELRLIMPENAVGAEPKKMKPHSNVKEQTLWCSTRALMDATAVKKAAAMFDPQKDSWSILVELTDEGAKLFAQITTDYAHRQLGIVSEGKLISAPYLREPITGGKLEISGWFTEKEARDLAEIFKNGTPSAKPKPDAGAQKDPTPDPK